MRKCPGKQRFAETKRLLLFIIIFLFSPFVLFAQITLQGEVKDTTAKVIPARAVISLLLAKDSVLHYFTRSGEKGTFTIENVEPGEYILMLNYPGYADYIEKITINGIEEPGFKTIFITPKAMLLDEVILRQNSMRLRGDTTEYVADSFYVKAHGSVEDLLKQLPGLQVDEQGNIIAQGKRIEKIMVDGQEFFSDDPTIATKNIRADAINKVQIFDKKSEQSEFTGVDDGNTTKTLNLELKANAKRGYFGKLSAGALDEYYNTQALVNSFKGKRQFSAFAIASTTNETGLNSSESDQYGFGSGEVTVDEGSGTVFINSSAKGELDAGSFTGNEGLPTSIKGGIHYANKWNKDRLGTNNNYLINKLTVENQSNTLRQNFLEDSVYYNSQKGETVSDQLFNGLNSRFDIAIDSTTSIMMIAKGKIANFDHHSKFDAEVLDGNNEKINESKRRTSQKGNNTSFGIEALLKKKFKKPGRTLSLSLGHGLFEEESVYSLFNATTYPSRLSVLNTEIVDEKKDNIINNNHFQTQFAFTEKLSEHSFLELNYSMFQMQALEDKRSYRKNSSGEYSVPIDSLSNKFSYSYNIHSGGARYSLNFPKTRITIGGKLTNIDYQNKLFKTDAKGGRNTTTFFPDGSFSYKFNANRFIKVTYDEQAHQPQMQQLQPITNNIDPVNIYIGNPDLRQEIEKNLQINFSNYDMLKDRYLFVTTILTFTPDMFTYDYSIDKKGKRITRFVNSDGYSATVAAGYNFKVSENMRMGLAPSLSYASFPNFVNGQKNISQLLFSSIRWNVAYNTKNFWIGGYVSPENNISNYSISKGEKTNLWNLRSSITGGVTLPWKMETGVDFSIYLREKISAFDQNNNVFLWNAYIEKKFLKTEALALRFSVNDILNQNAGFVRNLYSFYNEERNYSTFKRYGLLALTYNFVNKGGSAKNKADDSIQL